MPYKFNESRRHEIPRAQYHVTNWPEYDAALVKRGSLTVWMTEGLLRSIADVLEIDIAIPDRATLSRRGVGLTILPNRVGRTEPPHLLIDSTGLKIYGEGEWLDQKHGIRSSRRWRKLHLAVDAGTHEIVAVELTPDDVGDIAEVPDLLDQIGVPPAVLRFYTVAYCTPHCPRASGSVWSKRRARYDAELGVLHAILTPRIGSRFMARNLPARLETWRAFRIARHDNAL